MKMTFLGSLLIVIAAFCVFSTRGHTCQSPALTKLLSEAAPYYQSHLFQKKMSAGSKTVVLTGETHFKGRGAHAMGHKLLRYFRYRGLELATIPKSSEKLWGSVRLKRLADKLDDISSLGIQGSTIFEAVKVTEVSDKGNSVEKGLRLVTAINFPLDLARKNRFSSKLSMVRLYVGFFGIMLGGSYFASLMIFKMIMTDNMDVLIKAIPSIWDIAPILVVLPDSILMVLDSSLAPFFHNYKDTRWYRMAFNFTYGLVHLRDRVMVETLDEVLERELAVDEILVVVGFAHVPGMTEELVRRGYLQVAAFQN